MNTLAPHFIVFAMLIVTFVLLKIGKRLPGFVPLKNCKAGLSEHKAEDGAS